MINGSGATTIYILLFYVLSASPSFAIVSLSQSTRQFIDPRRAVTSTTLFGTIKFVGDANAGLNAAASDSANKADIDTSLSNFLSSDDSNAVLLGMKGGSAGMSQEVRKLASNPTSSLLEGNGGEVYECRQNAVDWFGITLQPIFINVIERNSEGTVTISIIDAQTDVQGGRLGNTLASAMKRSVFEGRIVISWKETDTRNYTLEGNIKLSLTINLPPFLPLPPGFNAIGSKIVNRVCKERLSQNVQDISDAYLQWVSAQQTK